MHATRRTCILKKVPWRFHITFSNCPGLVFYLFSSWDEKILLWKLRRCNNLISLNTYSGTNKPRRQVTIQLNLRSIARYLMLSSNLMVRDMSVNPRDPHWMNQNISQCSRSCLRSTTTASNLNRIRSLGLKNTSFARLRRY